MSCTEMLDRYGPADEAESIATIHAGLNTGLSLFDTACPTNLLRRSLVVQREKGGPMDCFDRDREAENSGTTSRGFLQQISKRNEVS